MIVITITINTNMIIIIIITILSSPPLLLVPERPEGVVHVSGNLNCSGASLKFA